MTTSTDSRERLARIQAGLGRRRRAEKRFRACGVIAIVLGLLCVGLLFASIVSNGYTAFVQTYVRIDVALDPDTLGTDASADERALRAANYDLAVKKALRTRFPGVTERRDRRNLAGIVSSGAGFFVRDAVLADPSLLGTTASFWVPADDDVDMLVKGHIDRTEAEANRRIDDRELAWIDALRDTGDLELRFNTLLFTEGDSREPELAGIRVAVVGSAYTLLITLVLSFPIGVAAAVYLEEFAPTNRWTDLIEVNINNLAAVPSIVFGLLGLAVFIGFFGLPRSVPVVGGLVLTLMTLPTIIIASRAALRAVPPSIREGALGMGASRMQAVFHHVLPPAMPGMLTGTIIGMAQALGETAPLLMIGMVAFIADVPGGPLEPATVLPVQIFLWADSPERAFVERTSAAIMVLLVFLITMNALAVVMRRRFERRW